MYSIDVFNGNIQAETHLGKFALYVSFFPQLVAGPIERAEKLLPQFKINTNKINFNNLITGVTQILFGLYKKVVVADLIAIYVQSIYGDYELYTGFTHLFATYLFAIQIYCDFSGYSDIAIGSARILGYELMENFKKPYFSKSITEFWRRWHISLSTWLRDYLYISLGGNRKGKFFTYRNLMITMLLGGLMAWSFMEFCHMGISSWSLFRFRKAFNFSSYIDSKSNFTKVISGLITFNLVSLAWIFFRAENFIKATGIISRIFKADYFLNLKIQDSNIFISIIFNIFFLLILEKVISHHIKIKYYNNFHTPLLHVLLIILILLFGVNESKVNLFISSFRMKQQIKYTLYGVLFLTVFMFFIDYAINILYI